MILIYIIKNLRTAIEIFSYTRLFSICCNCVAAIRSLQIYRCLHQIVIIIQVCKYPHRIMRVNFKIPIRVYIAYRVVGGVMEQTGIGVIKNSSHSGQICHILGICLACGGDVLSKGRVCANPAAVFGV